MTTLNLAELVGAGRARRLKALTQETHERLDQSIMAAASFATLTGYARFVSVQFLFHRDIDALYDDPTLGRLLPGLADRRRFGLIAADLRDLGVAAPTAAEPPVFVERVAPDVPMALGWLYVAEGSNLGAALLRKEAMKLGLSDAHGARHLAPAPEGPAAAWRTFTTALDAVSLGSDEEARVQAGAEAAFARVQRYADTLLR